MTISPDAAAPARRRRPGRSAALLAGMWVLGLVALVSIVVFENRVDQTRRAQVTIADLRNEQGTLTSIAFSPALVGVNDVPTREQTARQMAAARLAYNASLATLATYGRSDATQRIEAASGRYFTLVDRLSGLVHGGKGIQAARDLGAAEEFIPLHLLAARLLELT